MTEKRTVKLGSTSVTKLRGARALRAARTEGRPNTARGQEIYSRAKAVIPGGTQLLSKRPEMFLPGLWPSYYERAAASRVWDCDGNELTDMSYCGIGSTVLGYADADVNRAVKQAVDRGSMTTLNCPEEVELAELMVELHPWASMVRFQRGGGEAMSVAIRIARACTQRQVVAFCGYHGWHDWYLAANLTDGDRLAGHLLPGLDPLGVPDALRGTALPFRFNHLEELRAIIAAHGGELAAVVMEPYRSTAPDAGFLAEVKRLTASCGALLVFDEITIGWRLATGGAHLRLGVSPDLAVFAKAMGNGFPISAVIGAKHAMEAAQGSFISSTFWTERIGSTAALATIRKHRDKDVARWLAHIGTRVCDAWTYAAKAAKLAIEISGVPALSHFNFADMEHPQEAKTAFTQLMLDRGFLANTSFYAMFVHSDEDADRYAVAAAEAFHEIGRAANGPGVRSLLRGPAAHSGFRRLN